MKKNDVLLVICILVVAGLVVAMTRFTNQAKTSDGAVAVVTIDGKEYAMKSCHFPTISADNPNALTPEEDTLMKKLHHSFRVSEKLRKHIRTILSHGCMFTICNQIRYVFITIILNTMDKL